MAPHLERLAEALFRDIAAGVGEEGRIKFSPGQLDHVLEGGARWAVEQGYGVDEGLTYVVSLAKGAGRLRIALPDRELACAPIDSPEGREYPGAMNAAVNCALANRQILAQLTRRTFAAVLPQARLETLYDVSHNTCKAEKHKIDGTERLLYVHRKGATRAFGPGHPALPPSCRAVGQPVVVGGSIGTGSYVLAGKRIDVDEVAEATERAALARRVAFLRPKVCIKG